MLERARASVPQAELLHGSAERLPWPEGSFDRVLCINALHHFADAPAFIAGARRVLRPGGGLIVVGLDPHTASRETMVLPVDLRLWATTATIAP